MLVTSGFTRYKFVVLFSCKISHSVLSFLDRHGEDLSSLYEQGEWPAELLRDPSYWLEAEKMESLLKFLSSRFGHAVADSALMAEVGRHAPELRAWGALDSVLRLVQAPKDLFAQPERLLSYFISPAPPVGNLRREADSVAFELPLDASEYPLTIEYMRGAFEALPTYVGRPAATAEWQGSFVTIRWTETQESLFSEGAAKESRTLNPELVRNVLQNLEESQRRLEEAKTHLARKTEELDAVKAQLRLAQNRDNGRAAGGPQGRQERLAIMDIAEFVAAAPLASTASPAPAPIIPDDAAALPSEIPSDLRGDLSSALDQAYRLGDYMGRAQQLVTLLIAQGRANAQVQEAMRRMDWPTVQANAPSASRSIAHVLQNLHERVGNRTASSGDIHV